MTGTDGIAETYQFQLFIAGDTPNSVLAINNLNSLCEKHLVNRHQIDIVDVLAEPSRALTESIFMTPTLVRISPLPARRIIGNLSDFHSVLEALGLNAASR